MNEQDSLLLRDRLGRGAADRALRNICGFFACRTEDLSDFRLLDKGMTNRSFVFSLAGERYVYRHPGPDPGNPIGRSQEKRSLELARSLGVNPVYLYADGKEGWMLSRYVADFREPDYDNFEDTKRILRVLRKLHAAPVRTDCGLRPWADSLRLEAWIRQEAPDAFTPWEGLKEKIRRLAARTRDDGVEPCFCHGDAYRPNWMLLKNGETILIDWEYAGTADPGIDLGYYIVDAMYGFDEAERLIREYLGKSCGEAQLFHFMAYTAIIAYYWFVWALLREVRGIENGGALERWRTMAIRYADHLLPAGQNTSSPPIMICEVHPDD